MTTSGASPTVWSIWRSLWPGASANPAGDERPTSAGVHRLLPVEVASGACCRLALSTGKGRCSRASGLIFTLPQCLPAGARIAASPFGRRQRHLHPPQPAQQRLAVDRVITVLQYRLYGQPIAHLFAMQPVMKRAC